MGKALNVSLAVTADTSQAKAQLQQLQQTLSALSSSSAGLKIGVDTKGIKEASNAALELGVHLKQATNPDTGVLNFAKLNNSIKASGQTLSNYGQQLLSMGRQGQQAFSQLATAVAKSEIPMNRLGGVLGNFKTVISNTLRWQVSSSVIHGFMGAISTAYNYAKDLNKSLTDIQIVTQASDQHMAQFAEQANKAAKALSTTTTAYTKASLIYYQQGLSDKEVKERTDVTVKMANITGQTAQEVSNQMTAIWNNFAKGGENLEYYADVITALGAATASSSEEISTGLQKFAAIADTVGLSYENATAALATITATTRQSADSVGTGLRTVFSRLQSLKLGETLEDGVDLTKYSKALKTIGVDVLTANGNLRSMDSILSDMMDKWDGLTQAQKTALAQTVGGVRQYTTIMALMENSDFYKENLQIAKDSKGTVAAQQAIYEKSWKASTDRLKASFEIIYSSILNDKFFIGLNNTFSKLLNFIHELNTGFGGLRGTLTLLSSILMKVFSTQMTQGLYKFGLGVKEVFTPYKKLQSQRDSFLQQAAGSALGYNGRVKYDDATGTYKVYTAQGNFDQLGTDRRNAFASYLNLQRDFTKQAPYMSENQQMLIQGYLDNYDKIRQEWESNIVKQQEAQWKSMQAGAKLSEAKFNGLGFASAMNSKFLKRDTTALTEADIADRMKLLKFNQDLLKQGKTGFFDSNGLIDLKKWQSTFDTSMSELYTKTYGSKEEGFMGSLQDIQKASPIMKEFFNEQTMGIDQLADKLAQAGLSKADGGLISQILGAKNAADPQAEVQKIFETFQGGINNLSGKNLVALGEIFNVDPSIIQDYLNSLDAAGQATDRTAEAQERLKKALKEAQDAMTKQDKGMQIANSVMNIGRGITSLVSLNSSVESLVQNIHKATLGGKEAEGAFKNIASSAGSMLLMATMGFGALQKGLSSIKGITPGVASAIAAVVTVAVALYTAYEEIQDIRTEDAEELEERLANGVNQSTEAARQSKQAFDDLLTKFEGHNELLDEISNLTAGTIELRDKILEANNAAQELIEMYGLIEGKDFQFNKNGTISITPEGQRTAREKAYNNNLINNQNKQMAKILNDNKTLTALRDYGKDRQDILDEHQRKMARDGAIMGFGAGTVGYGAAIGAGGTVTLPVIGTVGGLAIMGAGGIITAVGAGLAWKDQKETDSKLEKLDENNKAHLEAIDMTAQEFSDAMQTLQGQNDILNRLGLLTPIQMAGYQAANTSGKSGVTWDEQMAVQYMTTHLNIEDYDNITKRSQRITNDAGKEIVDFTGKGTDIYDISTMQDYAKQSLGEDWYNSLTKDQQEDKEFLRNAMQEHEAYKITNDLYSDTYNDIITPFLQKYGITQDMSKLTPEEKANLIAGIRQDIHDTAYANYNVDELTEQTNAAYDAYQAAEEEAMNTKPQERSVLLYTPDNGALGWQKNYTEARTLSDWASQNQWGSFLVDEGILSDKEDRDEALNFAGNDFEGKYGFNPISFTGRRGNRAVFDRTRIDAMLAGIENGDYSDRDLYDYNQLAVDAMALEAMVDIANNPDLLDTALDEKTDLLWDKFVEARTASNAARVAAEAEIETNSGTVNAFEAVLQQQEETATNELERALLQNSIGGTIKSGLTVFDKNRLTKMVDYFGSQIGPEFGSIIFEKLQDDFLGGKEDLFNFLSGIELTDSTIRNNSLLKQRAEAFDKKFGGSEYTQLYEEAFRSMGGEAALFEELYNSEDFADNLKTLQKTFKNTGKIGSANILELAENSEMLQELLEDSDITAQGLADTLEAITLGDINADQVSSGLLRALSIAGELEDTLGSVYQHIDQYSSDRSVLDIGSFYSDRVGQIKKSQEAGMLLDAPLMQSWRELFGNKSADAYAKDIQTWTSFDKTLGRNLTPEEIQQKFNEKYAAEIAMMQSIEERGNLSGVFDYYFKQKNPSGQMKTYYDGKYVDLMHFNEETGQVEIDNEKAFADKFKSQKDFINFLKDNLNVPKEMAEAMAAEYAATNGWARDLWGREGAQKGLEELKATLDKGAVLSMDEIEAFANQYGEFLKLDDPQWLQHLIAYAKEASGAIVDLGDDFVYTSSTWGELSDALKEHSGISLEEFLNKKDNLRYGYRAPDAMNRGGKDALSGYYLSGTGDAYDVVELRKSLMQLGYSIEDANDLIDSSNKKIVAKVRDEKGHYSIIDEEDEGYTNWLKTEERGVHSAENMADYVEYRNEQALIANQAKANADAMVQALAEGAEVEITPIIDVQGAINSKEYYVNVSANVTGLPDSVVHNNKASGYNNAKSFAGGKHSNGQYEGPAIVGELGPEAWVHDGQVDLVGQHGREMIYLHKDDSIYTAAQTREMPGFSVGYNPIKWDEDSDSNADAGNAKTSKWEPERYHLITRQLKDLEREYDRLSKIKDNAYGTNKLEAIQAEIDATNQLIEGQKALIRETEDYLAIDVARLKKLLDEDEFQIDENGNLLNFEELQKKYRKKAEEDKDEKAQDIWKALQQYEETIDKLQEANVEMQDLLYQEMELRLEKITTKVEMRIDFDEREIKLLDHYIKRIDDNIYHTAEVLALTEQKLGHINQKIEDTKQGITELFEEMSDSQGNKITKEDGSSYTLEEWLAMSKEERDLLDINDNFGKQLEEYMDDLLDYIEELEEFKTKGVEEFGEAFSELNDTVRSSIDLFDHYNQLLSSLKNITQLQGIKLSAEMKAAMKEINAAMFSNTQNNIDAERENYRRLSANVADLRKKVAETTDETLKRQWEEQLKTAEEELRTSEQNLLSLWETGLQQAKDMFETALQDAADEYEATISGMYGTTDELQKAWDQQKKNDEFYVKDYEKYYQISKLQRSITKDLDAAARAGNKQNKGLKKLYDELNAARENGVELSAYDLDIFEKRYEYEKALMELEDARNNKSEVRLQRDANGNWGYVYTSSADEDDLIAKQQAVDDKFYELQKATQERVASLSDDMMSEITGVGKRLQELYSSGASDETIAEYLAQESKYIENYRKALAKALEDAGMTEEEARLRYGNEGFDILDQFSETLLSSITGGNESLEEFFARAQAAMEGTNHDMEAATGEYQDSMDAINKWFNESGEDLATVIHGFASIISEESDDNLLDSKEQIQNAKDTFDEILRVATQFEQQFMSIYQPIIDANEQLVVDLLFALHALNREEYEGPDYAHSTQSLKELIESLKLPDLSDDDQPTVTSWTPPDDGDDDDDDEDDKPKYGGCFVPGTKILMSNYSNKNIEDIQVGDFVIAYNEETQIYEAKKVLHSYAHYNTIKILDVYLSDGTILSLTACHPILTTDGWKSLDHDIALYEHKIETTPLEIGQEVVGKDHNAIITNIIWREDIPNYTTYNITVEDDHTYIANGFIVHNMAIFVSMLKYASGGYTGEWGPGGRAAILHEKELVLNKDDTKNFLNATKILRTIDLQTNIYSKGLGNITTPQFSNMKSQEIEQDVHIEANFPNVQDRHEIEAAFDNLINKATQYANRKNMSAMTFQDMYTDKF